MKFEIKVPQVGESITEVTIGQWLKNDGDFVEMDEVVCEIESEKATIEVTTQEAGKLNILVPEGETVPIGKVIAQIDSSAKKAIETAPESKETEPAVVAEKKASEISAGEHVRISPVAAKLLEEAGVPAEKVTGSGAGGRITKSDAQAAARAAKEVKEKAEAKPELQPVVKSEEMAPYITGAGKTPVELPKSKIVGTREERRVKLSTLRKTIARRLVEAKNQTAMLTTFNELDMSPIIATRAKYKETFQKKYDIKLGFMSFFVKAATIALQEFPEVNASLDEEEIVYHDYCDISIAVSTPQGLVVPVIFNAEQLGMADIEMEVTRLAQKARDKKLSIEEMTGGTFSLTNGGVFGSLLSTPIVNPPQSAILGMHKIEERPVALDGQVVIRPMMYVALSYDHRIIDGKESVSFLVRMKELLEDPVRMLLEV